MKDLNYVLSSILFFTTFVIIIIAIFVWRRRKTQGGLTFFYVCISIALYTFGYAMELISVTLSQINFWGKFQYVGLAWLPSLSVWLAYDLTGDKKKLSTSSKRVLITIPCLTFLFRLTNEFHQLMYVNMKLVNNGYFNVLSFERGYWYIINYVYFVICCIISIVLYYRGLKNSTGYKHRQLMLMLIVSFYPVISLVSNQLGVVPLQVDIGSFIVPIAYIFFTIAIFRYDMMHIIPLSRDKIFDWIYDGVIVTDIDLNLKDFNKTANKFFPALNQSYIGRSIELCTAQCPDFAEQLKLWYENNKSKPAKCSDSVTEDSFEFGIISSEAGKNYYNARLMGLLDRGSLVGITVLITDITKEKVMLIELEKMAQYDYLTGLLNRRYFIARTTEEFNRLKQQSGNGFMVMYDIDHFKQVNDIYGHQAGDYILSELAYLAESNLRNNDLLGRYGGEEFIAFLPEISLTLATTMIEKIRNELEKHIFFYNGVAIKITASFGMVPYYNEANQRYYDFDEIVKYADEALYQAKNSGRNRSVVFSELA